MLFLRVDGTQGAATCVSGGEDGEGEGRVVVNASNSSIWEAEGSRLLSSGLTRIK